nr:NADH dehydrogenase subunit 6 [Bombylius sp.]
MIQMIMYSTTLMCSLVFLQMSHPLAMGLLLLIQTVLICIISGLMAKTFWFSYVLFLIFLGGMLVLFIYVTSIASNEMFSMSAKLMIIASAITLLSMMVSMVIDKSMLYQYLTNNECLSINMETSYMKENSISLIKLYNYPTNLITIIMINYLLISLVAIVKITNVFHGPLRPMYN